MGKQIKKINVFTGLTLIEMMITISILMMLIGLSFYFFRNATASSNLLSFSEMLYGDLLTTQQLAKLEGKNYIINFDKKNYTISVEGGGDTRTRNVLSYLTIEKTTFNKLDPGKNKLRFFANTGTPSQGGTITILNDIGKRKYVIVSYYIGRIRISDMLLWNII